MSFDSVVQSWEYAGQDYRYLLFSRASVTIITDAKLMLSRLSDNDSDYIHSLKVMDVPSAWRQGLDTILV